MLKPEPPEAGKFVYPESNFQYYFWHSSQTLMKEVSHLPPKIKDVLSAMWGSF